MQSSPQSSLQSELPSSVARLPLHQPLNFFDDFAYVLLSFLEQQQHSDGICDADSSFISSCIAQVAPPKPTLYVDAHGATDASTMESAEAVTWGSPFVGLQKLLLKARRVVENGEGKGEGDGAATLSQSSLYLLRLKQLLEEQVHSSQAATRFGLGSACSSPHAFATPMTLSPPPKAAEHAQRERLKSTIHSSGRRYSIGVAESPRPPAVPASHTHSKSQETSKGPAVERGASALPAEAGRAAVAAFHGELLLHIQQHFVGTMSYLDVAITAEAHNRGGIRGVVTEGLAETLQSTFVSTLLQALERVVAFQSKGVYANDPEVALACGEVVEVAARISRAASVPDASGAAEVFQATTGPFNCKPANSANRCPSAKILVHEIGDGGPHSQSDTSSAAGPPPFFMGMEGNFPSGFGVSGSDFATRLVAQHVWCYQCLLHQRFSSYNGTWPRLERVRYFAESVRSPTPTAPPSRGSESSAPSLTSIAANLGEKANGARNPTLKASSASFASVSTSPSPVLRRGTISALASPHQPPFSVGEVGAATGDGVSAGGVLSQSNTPTRPPPLVAHTQEKPMRAPATGDQTQERQEPLSTVTTARELLVEGDASERRDHGSRAFQTGTEKLIRSLEPCLLFDAFIDRVVEQGTKRRRPRQHSVGTDRRRAHSYGPLAGNTKAASAPSEAQAQLRTVSASPVPFCPLAAMSVLGLQESYGSCFTSASSPPAYLTSRPSASSSMVSTEPSPSRLPAF